MTSKTTLFLLAGAGAGELPAEARWFYRGQLFCLCRSYAETRGPWLALSPRYGLVTPEQRLSPYGDSIRSLGPYRREEWARAVYRYLKPAIEEWDPAAVVFLAGKLFWIDLAPWIVRDFGSIVSSPLQRLTLNEQVLWLRRNGANTRQGNHDPRRTL